MKFMLVAAAALSLSVTAPHNVAAGPKQLVTVATEGSYAPWSFTKPDGTLDGFEPELLTALCDRADLECNLVASDWDSLFPAVNAGKFNAILSAILITKEREEVLDFTIPYASTPQTFATTKGSRLVSARGTGATIRLEKSEGNEIIEQLKEAFSGMTIGVQRASAGSEFVNANFAGESQIREYQTSGERDLDLQSGRVDVVFDDATYFTSTDDFKSGELALTGPLFVGPIWGEGIGIGVSKTKTELREKLDQSIRSMVADGTLTALSMKWFKMDVSPAE